VVGPGKKKGKRKKRRSGPFSKIAALKNDINSGLPSVREISRQKLRELYFQITLLTLSFVLVLVIAYLLYRHH